jgi:hypothetical protein
MKNLATLVAIAVIAFCVYKYRTDKAGGAAKPALVEGAEDSEFQAGGKANPAPGQGVAIARALDPFYKRLFADLDRKKAEDLVPPLTVTRERLAAGKAAVEPAKHGVYDLGILLTARMIDTAEERTKALEAVLQAAANEKSSLDSKGTLAASKAFLAEATARRWEDEKRRRKVVIDQLMERLRAAETQWNAGLAEGAPTDNYDIARLDPVFVSVETKVVGASALDQSKHNQTRTMYPWRRAYYQKYGSNTPR